MTVNSEIILLGQNLSEGESLRVICPLCRGGTSGEKSLSVTRNEGIVWQCFRAKCGTAGGTKSATFSKVDTEKTVKRKKPTWDGDTSELPTKVADAIERRWEITKPQYWYWTTDYGGRVAMSIRSPKDTHRGWVLRSLGTATHTKALTYTGEGEEGLSWYKTHPYRGTLVVEDIPSALRAAAHLNSVALLGTGVGTARAQEIAQHATRPIIMALDQDATGLSFRWARKWSLLWGDVKVLPLTKDIKDMSEDEIKELIAGVV